MKHRGSIALAALALAFGCSGKETVYEVIFSSGGAALGGGSTTFGGDTSTAAGTRNGSGGVVSAAGSGARGGEANASGAGGGVVSGGGGVVAGSGGNETMGDAGNAGAPAAGGEGGATACGDPIANVPADCKATLPCSGAEVVDQANVPVPTNQCWLGTCNAAGVPGTAPAPAGTACSAAGGGKVCDGLGKCVGCVKMGDCPDQQSCSATHQCTVASCTDVDCGGACPPCAVGKKCLADADCATFACDAVSRTCITPQCQDHHQDGLETDADCGGGSCAPCVLGKSCLVDDDCDSQACDALKLVCISYSCADHRADFDESDIDCGGAICNACLPGQKCHSTFDCQSAHVCNAQKVCQ